MQLVLIGFPVLAFLATLWGVYYSRQQLNEAKRIREENQRFFEDQRKEDNVWSEKCVRASQILCAVARFLASTEVREESASWPIDLSPRVPIAPSNSAFSG